MEERPPTRLWAVEGRHSRRSNAAWFSYRKLRYSFPIRCNRQRRRPPALLGRQLDEFRGVRRVRLYPWITAVGEDVDGAVGTYADVADAGPQLGK